MSAPLNFGLGPHAAPFVPNWIMELHLVSKSMRRSSLSADAAVFVPTEAMGSQVASKSVLESSLSGNAIDFVPSGFSGSPRGRTLYPVTALRPLTKAHVSGDEARIFKAVGEFSLIHGRRDAKGGQVDRFIEELAVALPRCATWLLRRKQNLVESILEILKQILLSQRNDPESKQINMSSRSAITKCSLLKPLIQIPEDWWRRCNGNHKKYLLLPIDVSAELEEICQRKMEQHFSCRVRLTEEKPGQSLTLMKLIPDYESWTSFEKQWE